MLSFLLYFNYTMFEREEGTLTCLFESSIYFAFSNIKTKYNQKITLNLLK